MAATLKLHFLDILFLDNAPNYLVVCIIQKRFHFFGYFLTTYCEYFLSIVSGRFKHRQHRSSAVWNYFRPPDITDKYATCHTCFQEVSTGSSDPKKRTLSNLKNHIKKKHNPLWESIKFELGFKMQMIPFFCSICLSFKKYIQDKFYTFLMCYCVSLIRQKKMFHLLCSSSISSTIFLRSFQFWSISF